MSVRFITGDCREVLRTLPAESVHAVVTSPPYWGLRDYGVAGQIGLEPSYQEFIAEMVAVFREVRRVLRADGTLWLNLGDSYASTPPGNTTKGVSGKSTLNGVNGVSGQYRETLAQSVQTKRNTIGNGLKPKDLCGIPWRVALALQAPDYLGRIRNEADRSWLAALVDGEGCISIFEAKSPHGSGSSYPPILQVRMCDPQCIEKAMRLVGSESDNPPQYPPSMEGQRPAYQWRIHGRKAADTIAEIYPFLLIKRKQAIVAWNLQAVRDGYETKRGLKIPADALEKQKLCREIIQKLNQREAVDLPSWMIEPPLPIGPGWYLRQDVIWSKPNPMPESVTDRCTKAHEYVFLLSKSERYYFDQDAIKEDAEYQPQDFIPPAGWMINKGSHSTIHPDGRTSYEERKLKRRSARTKDDLDPDRKRNGKDGLAASFRAIAPTRNKRSVWTVATQPFSEAHFATFPPALIEPCILAGCPKGGTVLDPFGGAGTTGLVADRLQRDAILIELNPAYAEMGRRRIMGDAPLFAQAAE